MATTGRATARLTSRRAPREGVRPPSASAALSSRRPAPPAWAARASSTDATQTSRRAGCGRLMARVTTDTNASGRGGCPAHPPRPLAWSADLCADLVGGRRLLEQLALAAHHLVG